MHVSKVASRKSVLLATAFVWVGSFLSAAVWVGEDGAFALGSNWSNGQVPSATGAGTDAVADLDSAKTVTISSGDTLTPTHLYLQGGGRLLQTGGKLTLTPGSSPTGYAANSAIGFNSAGEYEMTGGQLIVNGIGNLRIGHNANGVMKLSGTASAEQTGSGGNLYIGNGSGTSSLTLSDAANWTVRGSSGGDSLVIGNGSGGGSLTLNDSAKFIVTGNVKLGGTSGDINLKGGTLQVSKIWRGSGTASVNAAGGTITATRDRTAASGFFENLSAVKLTGAGLAFDTSTYTVWQGTGFSGEGNFTKTGAGTFVLNKSNSHGDTLISQGTLKVVNGGSLGFGAVTNNATLTFDRSTDLNVGNAISGTGNLVKTGSGTVTLGGTNTYTGRTTIENGTLRLQDSLPSNLEIMPMGDSITRGSRSNDAGYRGPLYTSLTAAGINFTFVGTSTALDKDRPAGSTTVLPDEQRHHEGHGGYVMNQMLGNLDGQVQSSDSGGTYDPGYWLTGNEATGQAAQNPDVILLMAGTNDIQIYGLSGIGGKLENLINKIAELRPDTKLIVAEITPRTDTTARAEAVDTYNEIVRQKIAAAQAAGKNVSLADMNDGFPANGLSFDKLHPQREGYEWMAEQWKVSLLDQYNRTGVSDNLPAGTDVFIAAAGALDLNNNQATIASLAGEGKVLLGEGKLTVNRSADATTEFSGVISGTGGFVKTGTGTQILSGVNPSYTGTTSVAEGKLVVNGSLASTLTTVGAGATLGGTGTLAGDLQVSGKLAPGNSPGALTVQGDVSLESTAVLEIVIRSVAEYSQLLLTGGDLMLAEGVTINVVLDGFSFEEGLTFRLIQNAGEILGASSVLADGKILEVDGHQFRIEHVAGGINLVSAHESSPYAYLAGGILALAGAVALRRRRG